ncbi:SecY-interacting protein [Enterobacterales bacterium CwR94]|nr:SecY-interacting protein [Enterobacterales bacterium CwR94]
MAHDVTTALKTFTEKYVQHWQQALGHLPASEAVLGVPSPCVVETLETEVRWQPQPFTLAKNLDGIERALDLRVREEVVDFYTTQFAGDMQAEINGQRIELLQVWSEEDFTRIQENLIGHLLMKRRLKHSPSLFLATTASELDIVSICNLTGEVYLEQLGMKKRDLLADSLKSFLEKLQPLT